MIWGLEAQNMPSMWHDYSHWLVTEWIVRNTILHHDLPCVCASTSVTLSLRWLNQGSPRCHLKHCYKQVSNLLYGVWAQPDNHFVWCKQSLLGSKILPFFLSPLPFPIPHNEISLGSLVLRDCILHRCLTNCALLKYSLHFVPTGFSRITKGSSGLIMGLKQRTNPALFFTNGC